VVVVVVGVMRTGTHLSETPGEGGGGERAHPPCLKQCVGMAARMETHCVKNGR